jgi:hypothetical protein
MCGCSGDQVINLSVSQVVWHSGARFDSNVNPCMRAVIKVLIAPGISGEAHPAEIVAAFPT